MEGNEMDFLVVNFLKGLVLRRYGAAAATSLGAAFFRIFGRLDAFEVDFKTDVLVIGYSGAGLWAAVTR